ncbi:MAG: cadherin domain-containing protein [Hyphomonadaceae bacterium]
MTSPFTQADIQRWRDMAGQGQRAQVYYEIGTRLTSAGYGEAGAQMFFQASISSYSGSLGGAALIGNDWAKRNAPGEYPSDLNAFSLHVLDNVLEYMRRDLVRGGDAVFTREEYLQIDYLAWQDLGVAHWFPGNLLRGEMAAAGWRNIPSDSIIYATGAFSLGSLSADAWGLGERAWFLLRVGIPSASVGDIIGLQADDWGIRDLAPGNTVSANGHTGRMETIGGVDYVVVRRDDPAHPGNISFGTVVNFYAVSAPFGNGLADFADWVYDTIEGDGGIWDWAGDVDRRNLMEGLGIDPSQWGVGQIASLTPEEFERLLAMFNEPSALFSLAGFDNSPQAARYTPGPNYWRTAFQLDGGRYVLQTVQVGIEADGVTEWSTGSHWRWRANTALPATDTLRVAVLSGDGATNTEIAASIGSNNGARDAPLISNASLASIVGSNLVTALGIDDPFANIALRTLAGTLALNVGQEIDEALGNSLGNFNNATVKMLPKQAFDDFALDFGVAAAGAISSFLLAELTDSLGVEGFTGEAVNSVGGTIVSQIAENLVTGSPGIFDGVSFNLLANAAGSFLGGYLAKQIVDFGTIGGQIGAAIGSGLGGIIGGKVIGGWISNIGWAAGPIGAFVGAFVGYILGGLIGSLFGGTAKAGTSLAWNEREQQFAVGYTWSKHGGSKDAVTSMASQVGELLNGVIAATGSHVADADGVQTGAYELKGSRFIYKESAAGSYAFASKDIGQVVNHGAFIALSDLSERLIGGDVYIKRALSATLTQAGGNPNAYSTYSAGDFEANTLFGNIATAQDYESYLQNAAVINALIAAEPESAFTAGWTITFARVIELGLDKRWKSDWLGGWAAFLDETADGVLDGNAFAPGNVFLELDPESNERLFVFVDGDGSVLGVLGDTIDTASKDVITGTAGNDTLTVNGDAITLTTALTLNGAAATAGAHKIRVAALIDGGAGNDTIRGGDLGNDLLGGDGNDTLIGGKLDDWMFGGAGDDRLYAGAVANPSASASTLTSVDGGNGDYLDGGEGNDALYGGTGSDWLAGGAGVDTLYGGAGGDILDGGAGDDRGASGEARIFGGAGSDNYVFYYGAGNDVVFDESDPSQAVGAGLYELRARYQAIANNTIQRNWAGDGDYELDGSVVGGEDAISFGPGIGFRNLVLKRSDVNGTPGDDLIIELTVFDENGARVWTGDSLTIKDWFDETRRVEWLRFADGEEIRIGDLSSFIIGTAASDVIIGTYGSDFILGEDGDDYIRGLSGSDFGFGGRGRDFVAGDENNDWVLGGDDDDQVEGGTGNDTVFGDNGNDIVYGGDGADIVAGGRGDDIVVGGAGNDLFKYSRGDGRDTMFDAYSDNWDLVYSGGAYVNGYVLTTQGEVVKNGVAYFTNGAWEGLYDWRNAPGKLYRHLGADASGATTADLGEDTLEFGLGIDIEDVQIQRSGQDLLLAIASGAADARAFGSISDQIRLQQWFHTGAQIENFVFAEIGALDISTMSLGSAAASDGDDALAGGSGRDWITGGLGDDQISGAAGDDILSGNFGADHLLGGAGADVLYGGADDDILDGGTGADTLIGGAGVDIASYASNTGAGVGVQVSLSHPGVNTLDAAGDTFSGIEGLEGTARADVLTGDGGDNVLIGGGGDDTLAGGVGDDDYEYDLGDGADTILDRATSYTEIVSASGVLSSGFTVAWQFLGILDQYGVNWYSYQLTLTRASDGAIVYQSRAGVDFLYTTPMAAAPVPDAWQFDAGQWKLGATRTGVGKQTILEEAAAGDAGADTLLLGQGISLSDISATRENSNQDLRLTFAQGGSVLIREQANSEHAIEDMVLADGLAGKLSALRLPGQAGTSGDDLFLGGTGNDVFAGGAGNDVISGGAGADTLQGGAGDDTLEGGAGADVLDGGDDSVSAGAELTATLTDYGDTIRYVRSAAGVSIDLAARTASGGDAQGDVIAAFTTSGGQTVSSIENVVGSEAGADTLRGDDRANRLAGLGGNDTLEGRGGDDVLIGGAGNDTLNGGDGEDNITGDAGDDVIDAGADADVVAGGDGNDAIQAGAGDDIVDAGAGADSVHGGDGKDQLSGGDGADTLYGDAGDDVLHGGAGNDVIYGGDGDDVIAGGEGADTLRGEAGDDAYVFDASSGLDQIIDAQGANTLAFADAGFDQIWITRSGADLRVGLIGSDASVLLKNYYAASGATLARSIAVGDRVLYLGHAEPLITAMTAASVGTPDAQPANVAALLGDYWHLNGKAAPVVSDQSLSTDEDVPLAGQVGAEDHDDQVLAYALDAGPSHGALALDAATGAWTYTPAADYNGGDSFVVRVTDEDGQSATQRVDVTINSVNDAPRDIIAPVPLEVDENADAATVIGTFAAIDVDLGDAVTFSLVENANGRFSITSSGVLQVLAYAVLDYEVETSQHIVVRATDAAGATLDKAFDVAINNLNEAPSAPVLASAPNALVGENANLGGLTAAAFTLHDPDGTIPTLELVGDAMGWLEVVGGAVQFKAGVSIDFEVLAGLGWTLEDSDGDGAREAVYIIGVRASDGEFVSAETSLSLRFEDVNEAPTDLSLAPSGATILERDRIDGEPTPGAIYLGSLTGVDPDLASSGAFAGLAYSVTDPRFEVINGHELYLKGGAMADLDYETEPTLAVTVTVSDLDGGPGALSFSRSFTFALSDRDDIVIGATADETLTGQSGRDRLYGMLGDDTLIGGLGDDDLYGDVGADTLDGGDGDDLLDGGAGDDVLSGGAGADTLMGGAGADALAGGQGDDSLNGGDGDDLIEGGAGADTLAGGSGADTLSYANSDDAVSVNLATGVLSGGDAAGDTLGDAFEKLVGSAFGDTLVGTIAAETIDGGDGDDVIEGGGGADILIGGDGDDHITGGADGDLIYGGAGADTLIGGAGADELFGGDGDDILLAEGDGDLLVGGAGNDILDGDVGSDAYVFDVNSGHDIIRDFDPEGTDSDQINFQGIDTSRLWFERVGDDLKISIVGADASVAIENWYAGAPGGNRRIEFVITSQNYSIDADGLTSLMTGQIKPADLSALAVLMDDPVYASAWAEFWGVNEAPVIGAIGAQTTDEDTTISIALNASDDFTDAAHLRYEVRVFDDAGLTQENTGVVSGWSITGPEGGQTLALTPVQNMSGAFYVQVKVFDLTDRVSEQVFALDISPVADAPLISAAAPLAATLDSGSLALNIQASLADVDGSEILEVRIAGIPAGLALNHGTDLGGGVWSLTAAQLPGLALTGPVSFAQDLSLTVTAIATETATGASSSVQATMAVPINARPTDLTASGAIEVAENAANGTLITTFSRTDADGAGDAPTYSLIDNAGGRFAINAATGALSVANGALLNYEAATSHQVVVRVTDAGGLSYSESFTVSITDVNEAPSLAAMNFSIAENSAIGAFVGSAALAYSDPDTASANRDPRYYFVLTDGSTSQVAASGRLRINQLTGDITVNGAIDYEATHSLGVIVRVWDQAGTGLYADRAAAIAVTDVNEVPTALNFTNVVSSIAENTSTTSHIKVADLTIVDDALGSENFGLTGVDAASFEIIGSALYLKSGVTLDRETHPIFNVNVTVDDPSIAGIELTSAFTLSVADVNETPTDIFPTYIWNNPGSLSFVEGISAGNSIARFGGSDPESNIIAYSLVNDAGGRFSMTGDGWLKVGSATSTTPLNFEAGANPTIRIRATDAGGLWVEENFVINIQDVNESPFLAAMSFNVSEAAPGAGQTLIGTVGDYYSDLDTASANKNPRYSFVLANGTTSQVDASGKFSIDATTGQIKLQNAVNYEDPTLSNHRYAATARVRDQGGAGLYYDRAFYINVTNVNEAPVVTGEGQATDPDGTTAFTWRIVSVTSGMDPAGSYTINPTTGIVSGGYYGSYQNTEWVRVVARDPGGLDSNVYTLVYRYNTNQPWAPIVLDLDGDGLELVDFAGSSVQFDMDGDGVLDRSGWVSADDGFLAIDRNGDGQITGGQEIAFAQDLDGAVSDLEGLRAFDTNANGFIDAGDERFGEFLIWQDANQNGVSDLGELTALAESGVVAINLTLTPTGQTPAQDSENVVYGTTSFVRADGSVGTAGDIFLAYGAVGGTLPPIILDLNGGGISLTSRLQSNVMFDADNDGAVQRTGWFGAGEGVLALDRNGDGQIGSGAEISFANDVVGARTDLEGLGAYDSNANGFLDASDTRYGEFLIWQDANQDGVSQASELRSLADWDIAAINLTPRLTGADPEAASDNVIYATTDFVRSDGSRGDVGDVFLSYDLDNGGVGSDQAERIAESQKRRKPARASRPVAPDPVEVDDEVFRRWLEEHSLVFAPRKKDMEKQGVPSIADGVAGVVGKNDAIAVHADAPSLGAQPGSLHHGLGVADSRVLHMINAMAAFGARDAADLARTSRQRDPRVAELLTALPDMR